MIIPKEDTDIANKIFQGDRNYTLTELTAKFHPYRGGPIGCDIPIGFTIAKPLSEDAEKVYERLKKKIEEFSGPLIAHVILVMPKGHIEANGQVSSKKGANIIKIDESIATYRCSGIQAVYQSTAWTFVNGEKIFENTVAHEYGHIVFKERIDETKPLEHDGFYCTREEIDRMLQRTALSEGFAFWFGDTTTDTRTNLYDVADVYTENGIDFNLTREVYKALDKAKEEKLDITKAKKIMKRVIEKHKKTKQK